MNIVIPMAGSGTRFKEEGFTLPKPLIEVNSKALIEHSVESLDISGRYIFVTRDYGDYNSVLSQKLKKLKPDSVEIKIDNPTRGSAETCLAAKELINNDDELIITNCDQRLEWDAKKFIAAALLSACDGMVVTHPSSNPKHSYAVVDKDDHVLTMHEKNPVSNNALIGVHYWSKGKDFVSSAISLLRYSTTPECYVSETYNYLIGQGKRIGIYKIDANQYISLGTPYDLNVYNGKVKEFFTKKPKTIFCDIDGTILRHKHRYSDLKDNDQELLEGVLDKFNEWDSQGFRIILCTARKESAREMTEKYLKSLGICWDILLMGIGGGERILINDKLSADSPDRATAINVITDQGFKGIEWKF
jgi:dTDP-glucose pyrophosphorylase